MCLPFDCCCPSRKYTLYITGSMEDKKAFCQNIFGLKLKDISFSENLVRFNGVSLILLVISSEEELKDVHQMHMRMANGIVMLRRSDEAPRGEKKVLFVRMNGRTQLESENNTIVCSVVDGAYSEAKKAMKEFTGLIKY